MGNFLRWVGLVARRPKVGVVSVYVLTIISITIKTMLTSAVLLPMERAIKETAEYCRQRKAFGKSILDNQVYNTCMHVLCRAL